MSTDEGGKDGGGGGGGGISGGAGENDLLLERKLVEIRDQLNSHSANGGAEKQKISLSDVENADQAMRVLSSCLFVPPGGTAECGSIGGSSSVSSPPLMSGDDALSVLTYLVSSDPAKYLRPASRAVRDEAENLASPSARQRPIRVSPQLVESMVLQLESSDVQVSTNAVEAIVACCKKIGPTDFGGMVMKSIAESWRDAWNAVSDPSKRSVASTVAVRCASVIVDLVCLDDAMMKAAQDAGDIRLILTMLTDESDPLLEVSTLDLIEKLATTYPMHQERARWLVSNDIVIPLLQMCGTFI